MPEIYGWVAWWKEDQAYDLLASQSGKVRSVSPVWWLVDSNFRLERAGKVERKKTLSNLRLLGIRIYPTIGSELSGTKLSPLFNNDRILSKFLEDLMAEIKDMDIDGLDIDLEGIDKADRESFIRFLGQLKETIRIGGRKMSVTIQAQDGKNYWFGAEGQDIARIAEIADEVRIMIYDRHSASSGPGPIAPLDWAGEVIRYNLRFISSQKLVVGIPSYGYIWPKDGSPQGLQWDEMQKYLEGKKYEISRDGGSGELKITGENFTGWLSDSEAMMTKMEAYRGWGLNKFVIWHLGGVDEGIFAKTWRSD
jgi:spore germination protein YaaH